MVDVGHGQGPINKSTAYEQLADELRQRDGGDEFKLNLLEHEKKLLKCYARSQKEGWTAEEMSPGHDVILKREPDGEPPLGCRVDHARRGREPS